MTQSTDHTVDRILAADVSGFAETAEDLHGREIGVRGEDGPSGVLEGKGDRRTTRRGSSRRIHAPLPGDALDGAEAHPRLARHFSEGQASSAKNEDLVTLHSVVHRVPSHGWARGG